MKQSIQRVVAMVGVVVAMGASRAGALSDGQGPLPPTQAQCEAGLQHKPMGLMGQANPCERRWGMYPVVHEDGGPSPKWQVLGANGEPAAEQVGSMCWSKMRFYTSNADEYKLQPGELVRVFDSEKGYGLNVDLTGQLTLGDFLPPSPDLAGSSLLLVPEAHAGDATGWRGLGRPTVSGVADLVTGMPLVQVQDLELPVAGGSFRLNRTRAVPRESQKLGQDAAWDWAGDGWMVSESPLLLVDSKLADIVGSEPATTYLVLDAHHSIPFQRVDGPTPENPNVRVRYEAPPRFRAHLEALENGNEPMAFVVSLYDGALRYYFSASKDETPDDKYTPTTGSTGPVDGNWNRAPNLGQGGNPFNLAENPGIGMPRVGLLTRITTNQGHAIEFEYCGMEQRAGGLPQGVTWESPADCIPCVQACGSKGQLKAVRVRVREGTSWAVKWTLLYKYRAVRNPIVTHISNGVFMGSWAAEQALADRMISQIVVYEGSVSAPAGSCDVAPLDFPFEELGQPVGEHSDIWGGAWLTGAAAATASSERALDVVPMVPAVGGTNAPQWQFRVNYHYADGNFQRKISPIVDLDGGPSLPLFIRGATSLLVKTTIQQRQRGSQDGLPDDAEITTQERVYIAGSHDEDGVGERGVAERFPFLNAVFEGESLRAAKRVAWQQISDWSTNDIALGLSVGTGEAWGYRKFEFGAGDVHRLPTMTQAERGKFLAVAELAWSRDGLTPSQTNATFDAPSVDSLVSAPVLQSPVLQPYVSGVERSRLHGSDYSLGWSWTPLRAFSARDASGQMRHYRLHRLEVREPYEGGNTANFPDRSIWHSPYRWVAYERVPSGQGGVYNPITSTPDYSKPRWINVIDEFPSVEARDGNVPYNASGVKPGQMSRRVVEVSPSGVVLRERQWQFGPDGEIVDSAGAGLGDTYVYETVGKVLKSEQSPLPPVPSTGRDPYAQLRNELVLLEHRTVGWSAVASGAQGSQGLVRFIQYGKREYDRDLTTPPKAGGEHDPDRVIELRPRAEGIRAGMAYEVNAQGDLEFRPGSVVYTKSYHWSNAYSQADVNAAAEQREATVVYSKAVGAVPGWDVREDAIWNQFGTTSEDGRTFTWRVTKRRNPTTAGQPTSGPVPVPNWPLESSLVVGPPRRQRPGGAWYFPVEKEWYTESGAVEWSAAGLVRDVLNPTANMEGGEELQTVAFTRTIADNYGRPLYVIADSGEGAVALSAEMTAATGEQSVSVGAFPGAPQAWTRIGDGSAPLNYVTMYRYDNPGGKLSDVFFPNGRRWASRMVVIGREERVPSGYTIETIGDEEVLKFTYDENERRLWWNEPNAVVVGPAGQLPIRWSSEPCTPTPCANARAYDDLPSLPRHEVFTREYVFSDLEKRGEEWISRMPGEIREYAGASAGGGLKNTRRVYFATLPAASEGSLGAIAVRLPDDLVFGEKTQPRFVQESQVELKVDADGQTKVASLLEVGADGRLAHIGEKKVNELVDVRREKSIDGTITRVTRNFVGHELLSYIGTQDGGWAKAPGGSAPSPSQYAWEEPADGQADGRNNLVLTSRVDRGRGANDAWLPVMQRRYTWHPEWADDANARYAPPASDSEGYATRTQYDWRRRAAVVEVFGESDSGNRDPGASGVPVLSTSLTFFDNADRPIVHVSYGRTPGPLNLTQLNAGLNPLLRDASHEISNIRPDARAFVAMAGLPRPLSVVETLYGVDGDVVQRRTYNMEDGTANPTFHDEFTLSGRGGVQVFARRPGQAEQRSSVDGLGRLRSTRNVGTNSSGQWGVELGRTDFGMDADGNVVDTGRWERVVWPTGGGSVFAPLTETDAVLSRSLAWFDPKKRNTVSMELGTENTGSNTFTNSAAGRYVRNGNDGNASEIELRRNSATGQLSVDNPLVIPMDEGQNPPVPLVPDVAAAMVTVNHYDLLTGRLLVTRNPDGSMTRLEYDRAGRVAKRIEDAYATKVDGVKASATARTTEYQYQYGRLVGIKASIDSKTWQTTRVEYGADVLAEGGAPDQRTYLLATRRPDLVGRMLLPSMGSNDWSVTLRYTFDGAIAERIDARGVAFRYFYDGLGRLSEIVVGLYRDIADLDPSNFDPSAMEGYAKGVPVDRIGFIRYVYNDRNQLQDVQAYLSRDAMATGEKPISHTRYAYDLRGNLTAEHQMHGYLNEAPTPTSVPTMQYAWQYQASDQANGRVGHDRLVSMTYPGHAGLTEPTPRRVVSLQYGAVNTNDDHISRLTGMQTSVPNGTPNVLVENVAQFGYFGVGRRVRTILGHGSAAVDQHFAQGTEIGALGLDRFGRVKDLWYRQATPPGASLGQTLFRSRYGYSLDGKRVWSAVEQSTIASQLDSRTMRSQMHTYNRLGQLTGSEVGRLTWPGPNPTVGVGTPTIVEADRMLRESWGLDHVGNWASSIGGGAPWAQGRVSEGNLDGGLGFERGAHAFGSGLFESFSSLEGGVPTAGDEYRVSDHRVDKRNQLDGVMVQRGAGSLQNSAASNVLHAHDPAGNLIFDGKYVYQYDAWNRLVQVNQAAVPNQQPQSWDDLGPLVKHFTYDGLGRLIRTVSPYPSPEMQADGADIRAEHYFYDGARRVQDVQYDPVSSMAMMMVGGDIEEQLLAGDELETQADPVEGAPVDASGIGISLAASMSGEGLEGSDAYSSQVGPIIVPVPTFVPRRVEREYIWGPGDGRGGVDELLAQCDAERKLWPVLTDAGGDVVAVVGRSGPGPNAVALVAGQWTYDAYGAVISADHLLPHPMNKVGHKGLFAERLDVGVADATVQGSMVTGGVGVETPKLSPFGHHIYHNRNRVHNPQLGRFMQSDPNSSGVVVSGGSIWGMAPEATPATFDMGTRLGDGSNLYQYLRTNPLNLSDPLGLYTEEDAFEDGTDLMGMLDPLPGPSDFLRSILKAMVSDYSANLDFDLEWASDWSLPDDDHSRTENSWVTLAIMRGMYEAFDVDLPFSDEAFNPLDWMGGTATGGPMARRTRGGESKAAKQGRIKHSEMAAELDAKGWKTEKLIPGVGRPDAHCPNRGIVLELKPFTPSGIARGHRQLAEYLTKMNARVPLAGGRQWTGHVVYYMPGS